MQFSDYIAALALLVSAISAFFSIWFRFRDRPRIKATSDCFPEECDDDGPKSPPVLLITIANHGSRVVYLTSLIARFGTKTGDKIIDSYWQDEDAGEGRLVYGRPYEKTFDPDSDTLLKDDDGNAATSLYFEDTLGNRYVVKAAKENIAAFLQAAKQSVF